MYEGMVDEALAVIRAVDDRYRREGLYFDHQEFGGHYYRPMGAWAIVNAMLGLTLHDGRLTFAPRLAQKNLRLFFAVPHATGHYTRKAVGGKTTIALRIATGTLVCRELRFDVTGKVKKASVQAPAACTHAVENGAVVVRFAEPVRFETGQQVVILLAR
jgi:hypothetical protein